MAVTNAISGVVIVMQLLLYAAKEVNAISIISFISIIIASINILVVS